MQAVAVHFASTEPLLAEALAQAEGQPEDEASDSQGWILRRALDAVVDRSRAAEALVARERRAAAALESEAEARGLTIEVRFFAVHTDAESGAAVLSWVCTLLRRIHVL